MAEHVQPNIPRDGIPLQRIGEGVEGHGREAVLVDVGQRSHHATVTDAQKVEIVGVIAVLGEHRDGVQA